MFGKLLCRCGVHSWKYEFGKFRRCARCRRLQLYNVRKNLWTWYDSTKENTDD